MRLASPEIARCLNPASTVRVRTEHCVYTPSLSYGININVYGPRLLDSWVVCRAERAMALLLPFPRPNTATWEGKLDRRRKAMTIEGIQNIAPVWCKKGVACRRVRGLVWKVLVQRQVRVRRISLSTVRPIQRSEHSVNTVARGRFIALTHPRTRAAESVEICEFWCVLAWQVCSSPLIVPCNSV